MEDFLGAWLMVLFSGCYLLHRLEWSWVLTDYEIMAGVNLAHHETRLLTRRFETKIRCTGSGTELFQLALDRYCTLRLICLLAHLVSLWVYIMQEILLSLMQRGYLTLLILSSIIRASVLWLIQIPCCSMYLLDKKQYIIKNISYF